VSGATTVLVTAVLLGGACHVERRTAVQQQVIALRTKIVALEAEAAALKTVLDSRPPPTAAVRFDNDPPGFDAARPLPAGDPRRPDVILLSIDTLRADHLGTYGYSRDTSPFFDRLAAEGTLFEQAWSPTSWTLPSHTTMLSGQNPVRHGAIEDHLRIAADVPLVQERFRAAGYTTVGAVATLFVSSRYGFERGFDHFVDFGIKDKATNNLSTVEADHVFHHALDWAQEQPAGQPMFVFLHVYDAHFKYDAPPPWNEKFDRKPMWGDEVYKNYHAYKMRMVPAVQLAHQVAQYDEEIAYVDDAFGRFVETWRGTRPAIVVVTADHGEEFGERGSWGHAHTLWPEQLHVPLIVNGPGVAVQRVTERVGTEDIAPTLAALGGIRFDAKDGVSRADQITTGAPPELSVEPARFAATSRFDTLVYRWHEGGHDFYVDLVEGVRSLCELTSDPECRSNLYRTDKERGEAMFRAMMAHLGEPWRALSAGRVEVREGIAFTAAERKDQTLDVSPGMTFAVEPGDAAILFHPPEGEVLGPWRPLGGSIPGARCPLTYGGRWVKDAELPEKSEEDIEMLEALGYVQEEADPEAPVLIPSGPIACP
jgi:arylsulfatase A-like enzyme